MSDESINSMCAIYSILIENELEKSEPNMDRVKKLLSYIKKYCQTVAYEKGETPEHLEEYLIEEGSEKEGTIYEGKPIQSQQKKSPKKRKRTKKLL